MKIKKHLSFSSLRQGISQIFGSITDWRQPNKVRVSIHDALMSAFACMHFQDPSLLQFQIRMEEDQQQNNVSSLFGVKDIPKETQMREIIDGVDSEDIRPVFKELYKRLQRNKDLEKYQIFPSIYYFPIDGTQFFSSKEINCEHCLVKRHKEYTLNLMCKKPDKQQKKRSITIYKEEDIYFAMVTNSKDASETHALSDFPDADKHDITNFPWQSDTDAINPQFSKRIDFITWIISNCEHTKDEKSGITYSHQVLQGGIAHPDCSEVIPFMPEQIINSDGSKKQDCEMNAAKRLVGRVRQEFPQLGLLIGGDALFSKQPIIEDIIEHRMHYLFVAKPSDHVCMMQWLNTEGDLKCIEFEDEKGRLHCYKWMNRVPLNGHKDTVQVNFLTCSIINKNHPDGEKVVYKNSWVTDLEISEENIKTLVRAGRCRWKSENEIFNVMKNHGYYMERNYGHGKKHLAFNFYLLTLLAFFFHQIAELTDKQYQACRKKFGSKRHFWETLRAYIKIIVFDAWESLLAFALEPKRYTLESVGSSP